MLSGVLLGSVCVLHAQAPIERRGPDQGPITTLKVQSRLVNIAVNAVEANGAPVAGLNQADFAIAEDGKPQKIAFFEKQSATPLSIVMAIDGSESVLTNERLEESAAKKFVRSLLRPQDEFDLMNFADDVREVVSFTNNKDRIESGLSGIQRGDATAVYDAVYLASQRLGETSAADGRRRVLVIITDGGNTVRGVGYDQAVEQAQRAGVMIYPLIVVPIAADAGRNTGGEHALIQMAADTGGRYYYINDPRDIAAAFQKLSDDLRTQYVIGYYAPEGTVHSRPDGFRALRVSLTDAGTASRVSLRFRAGYFAARSSPVAPIK